MNAGNKPRTCPRCGHRFVTRNLWHSCGRYRLADHFRDKEPAVRRLFDQFRSLTRQCGPVTVYAQKTRIVFQTRVRFAGVMPHKHWLNGGLWLTRRHGHRTVKRVEYVVPRCYLHHLRIESPADMDQDFVALIRSAYAVGQQAHLR